jgi:hypothetical protein
MRVDDAGFGGGPNSSITFNQNSISGYSIGLEEDAGGYMGGSLDATKNWWGSSTGPTIASNPGGTGALIIDQDGVVNYLPFLTSFSSCAPVPQIGPPTNKDQCKNDGWMDEFHGTAQVQEPGRLHPICEHGQIANVIAAKDEAVGFHGRLLFARTPSAISSIAISTVRSYLEDTGTVEAFVYSTL